MLVPDRLGSARSALAPESKETLEVRIGSQHLKRLLSSRVLIFRDRETVGDYFQIGIFFFGQFQGGIRPEIVGRDCQRPDIDDEVAFPTKTFGQKLKGSLSELFVIDHFNIEISVFL